MRVSQRFGLQPASRLAHPRRETGRRREKEKERYRRQLPLFCSYLEEADSRGWDASPVGRHDWGVEVRGGLNIWTGGEGGRWKPVALTGL